MAWATDAFQNWRDVADFAIDTVTADPDVSAPADGEVLLRPLEPGELRVWSAHPGT